MDLHEQLSDTKRRLVERLKRVETATAPDLAGEFGLTDTAVRQHLEALEALGLVERSSARPVGRGRPPVRWRLAPAAAELFPDGHGELSVDLLEAVREVYGEEGVQAVVTARTARQAAAYHRAIGPATEAPVAVRVARLADLRAAEGYLAEATSDGDTIVLTEHHCPIRDAAGACHGFCQAELALFRDVLGDEVTVERTSHAITGDARCSYRIRPV